MSEAETWLVAAAWAQAIGSIAAIGAGFALYFLQQQHARSARHQALQSMLVMANVWATGLKTESERASLTSDWGAVAEPGARMGRTIRALLERIDIGGIIDETVWLSLTNFWTMFDEVNHCLDREIAHAETHTSSAPVPPERKAHLIGLCNGMLKAAERLQSDLG